MHSLLSTLGIYCSFDDPDCSSEIKNEACRQIFEPPRKQFFQCGGISPYGNPRNGKQSHSRIFDEKYFFKCGGSNSLLEFSGSPLQNFKTSLFRALGKDLGSKIMGI